MLGHTQMLLKKIRTDKALHDIQEAEQLLQSVENYTKRCSHIVNSLLQFARSRDLQMKQTALQPALATWRL